MAQMMGPEQAPVVTQPELVGGVPPEQLPPEVTVADDVPRDVPENSFILNAAAVDEAGISDVADMLTNAIKRARELGIDIDKKFDNTSEEDLVKLLVSRGEVLIPEPYARIIGFDKLKKMNARGERETAKKLEEAQQQEQVPQQGAPLPQEQIIQQEAAQEPSGIQMMAQGGEAEDNRAGFGSAILSPVDTYQGMRAIEDFAVEATERYRQAKGTKAFAVDNILDAFRHFTGSMLLYRDYSDALAGTALTVNEILGAPGDYIAGAIDPNAATGGASREMDYHNNAVAKLHASKIPTAKFAQMSNRAVEEYARRYFDEIEAMYADGSIDSVDPRLVPMFSPAGNEGYQPMTPEVDTKSLYIKGPDNNWMENPNHPDVKARMERKNMNTGGVARDELRSQFAMPPKEAPSGDPRGESRSITQGMLEKGIIGDAVITPRDSLPPSMPMEIERMEPSTGGIVKPEHRDLPKILTGEQFLQMKKQVVGYISNNEVSKEELDNMLSMVRGMTSDEEFMRAIEIERGDPIVGDTPIMGQYPQNQFYDEEDARRIQDYNDRRDEVIESI